MKKSLAREAGEGLAWTGAAKTFAQLVGVGVTLALVRLLTPADFGLLGMVVVLTGFLSVFGEMGFATALVQREVLTESHRSSVFWLNVASGLLLGGLLAASAPLVAAFYRDERLVWLVRIIAIDFALAPLAMVQHALLTRELKFRSLALAESVGVLVSNAIALGMALAGYGVWSLVGKLIASTLATALPLWLLSPWRPGMFFDRAAIRELWSFSGNLMGVNVINYWARQIDDLLIGRVLGARPLGLYSRAYATMMMPVNEVGGVISRVMFPTFSKIKDDPARARAMYLRIIAVIGFITFPVMLGLAALAEPFIVVLYGDQWVGATRVLQITSAVGASQAIAATTGFIYTSQGRTDVMLRWSLFAGAVIIAGIGVGIYYGSIESVAAGYAVATVVVLSYPRYAIAGRLIGMTPADVFRATRGALACAVVAAAGAWALGVAVRLPPGTDLALRSLVVLGVYLVLARAFRVRGWVEALATVKTRLE